MTTTSPNASPRLCHIYLRDTYKFLSRQDVQSCRQISAHFDAGFHRYPEQQWPRLKVDRLSLVAVSSFRGTRSPPPPSVTTLHHNKAFPPFRARYPPPYCM